MSGESDDACIKLGDFGTAYRIKDGDVRSTIAGTKDFWAPVRGILFPELLNRVADVIIRKFWNNQIKSFSELPLGLSKATSGALG
jgi:hypothetical protein